MSSLPSLREGGTASGGEYAFTYCTPVLTLHKSEILHIQRNVPCLKIYHLTAYRWWSRRRASKLRSYTRDSTVSSTWYTAASELAARARASSRLMMSTLY